MLVLTQIKKAPNWFTSKGLQLPKEVQTILDANNKIAQNEPSVNNNSMQDSKEYSMPSETDTDYTAEMDALDEQFKNRSRPV